MLVYIQSNYDYPDLLRQTANLDGIWKNMRFTFDKVEECDYVIVLNHPITDIRVKCRKGGRILIIQEPPYERNNYLKDYFNYFDIVISGFDYPVKGVNHLSLQAMLPWLVNMNYSQLNSLSLNSLNKKLDKVSWVTSNSDVNPGHKPRLDLLEYFQSINSNIDIFGRGLNPLKDKQDGIMPYKYTLAIENYSAKDYWTEKIADAFLTWTMPVYFGCLNIEDYFPPNSFIKINIHKQEEAFEIIKNAIEQDLWTKNINAINEARNLILNKYQFFPAITNIMDNYSSGEQKKIQCVIPSSIGSTGLIKKVKSFIGKK
jgi:hypothetical protein